MPPGGVVGAALGNVSSTMEEEVVLMGQLWLHDWQYERLAMRSTAHATHPRHYNKENNARNAGNDSVDRIRQNHMHTTRKCPNAT